MEATSGNAIWKQLHRRIMSVATRRFQVGIEEDDDFGKELNNESISHDPVCVCEILIIKCCE